MALAPSLFEAATASSAVMLTGALSHRTWDARILLLTNRWPRLRRYRLPVSQRHRVSTGSGRFQEYNYLGAVLGRCEPAIWHHVVARHDLIGFRDEPIELLFVPYKVRALHGTGITLVRQRTGFPSVHI